MGSLGVHFAIDDGLADGLLSAEDDEELLDLIEEIEEDPAGIDHCDTDKAWDAIHRSLTDGDLSFDNGEYPLNAVVLGGFQLYEGDDFIVSYLDPAQVREVATALDTVTRETLRDGYDAIDEQDYGTKLSDVDFEYTWDGVTDLQAFFERAVLAARHVIFTVDQ